MTKPTMLDACRLFFKGAVALSDMSRNGIAIDTDYMDALDRKLARRVARMEAKLKGDEVWGLWRKSFGVKANMGSLVQLGHVLFNVMGLPCRSWTAKSKDKADHEKRPKVDDEVLVSIDHPFARRYTKMRKAANLKNTFLGGIRKHVVDGFLHPSFPLNFVKTFRSSAKDPNAQNFPIRDPVLGPMIRKCFVPREGWYLIEADFGALEFSVAACYWEDPEMIAYATDPAKDIHRDLAMRIFRIPKEEVTKSLRYEAKSNFTFAHLYGSFWKQMAVKLWATAIEGKLTTASGKPIRDVLREKGIAKLGSTEGYDPEPGTFLHHVKGVEEWFDGKFHVFIENRDRRWKEYLERGWFDQMTGFREGGIYSRNDLLNHPIQGPGFHLMLMSLILARKEIKRRKMRTLSVLEIHDCGIFDAPPEELQDTLNMIDRIMSKDIRKLWPWIVVPLKVEIDVVSPGKTWADKEPWHKVDDVWKPKKEAA